MDDLRIQIDAFYKNFESTYLCRAWPEHLLSVGIEEKEMRIWATEIGHVIEEYHSSLRRLANLF